MEEVVARRHQPDASEFAELYRGQVGFVWRMLTHFGVREASLEDATQEVFIVVHRRWASWREGVSARSWIYGIVRRVAADHRRAQGRHLRKLDALPRAREHYDLETVAAERELIRALELELERLSPEQREVFVLVELEGMTTREVGELTGDKRNTVASRLRLARACVRKALARVEQVPEGSGRSKRHAG